ncbi:MAG TPA: hypothetical protein PLX18_11430 [Anaerohalosphaeraceae bacterium]|nr:hypothetical protein [Anaerohalosphaeraceae bacterium]HQG06854.1 hypothetical protein [Anaerohalosphaeraceae bacterium]HQI08453.1 hypothetical protein [Anaerohalosphaeraceae bacterium]HQJ68772.1 hypothetical protein [Anaerohalosphaeraceae bacterium]
MACRQVPAEIRRKMGIQYWAFECPYCRRAVRQRIGDYTINPAAARFIKARCCGANLELKISADGSSGGRRTAARLQTGSADAMQPERRRRGKE